MADNDMRRQLAPLMMRNDVPEDARKTIATAIATPPWLTDPWIYRAVVGILGLVVLGTVFGGLYIAVIGHGEVNMKLPDAIVAIGSAAVGALAGLLAPSPVAQT